ncbi:DUF4405 domain-containing protein [Oleomonas cavernae]|uniref:DUF4405 domain-containing protein n=1 Tax=Oleomonas cavernae TaxID=2320859 RepID=A0A418W9X6_9PROT|nr:DUF4405 domain-containing protein [Oleomonas cavernae]RJF86837.1 DUF4405 domain-containing protein [Oleomonas cavernae]
MNKVLLLRLALDFVAAGLVLVGLAYYWLDNTIHELVGTGMFLLIIVHNTFNRRWYGTISRTRREPRGLINSAMTLSLLAVMLALLVTSLVISRALFDVLPLNGGYTARQIHTLAAYWALVMVSIHLGLRWSMIMSTMRNLFGLAATSAIRTAALRAVAAAIAACGVQSSFEMGVGAKLSLQLTLDWWDFEASTLGFFLRWLSIGGLYVFLAHYLVKWARKGKRPTAPVGTCSDLQRWERIP